MPERFALLECSRELQITEMRATTAMARQPERERLRLAVMSGIEVGDGDSRK